jgi:hypothetical protein
MLLGEGVLTDDIRKRRQPSREQTLELELASAKN